MPDALMIEEPVLALEHNAPLGPQIDFLWSLREKKRALEADVDEVKVLITAKEDALQRSMEAQGVDRAAGRRASVGINESVVPQVTDWDAYWAYIRRNNAFELLEKRPAAAAWREHAANRRNHDVPGTVPFTKRTLSIRVLS